MKDDRGARRRAAALLDGSAMMNIRKGDRVTHAQFGPGVVLDVNVQYTDVAFDGAGVRRFVTTLVRLDRCNLPTPETSALGRRRRKARRRPNVAES